MNNDNVIPISELVARMETEQLEPAEFERVIKYAGDEREAALAELARINKAADDRAAKDKATADQFDKDTTPPNRFRVLTPDDLRTLPRMTWLVNGLIPKAELVCIYGPRSSGKSFYAYDLLCAIERGEPFGYDRLRVSQANSIYVYCEGGHGARGRDDAYIAKHGDGTTPRVIIGTPNLLDGHDLDNFTVAIEQAGGASVIVFDTLSRLFGAARADENSAKDGEAFYAAFQKISKRLGAVIIPIAHTGKDTTRGVRGTSAIEGAADALIEISQHGDTRSAYISKQKDGPDGDRYSFKLETVRLGLDTDGEMQTSCVVNHIKTQGTPKPAAGPRGKYVDAARNALKELHWISGEWIAVQSVVDIAKTKFAAPPEDGKQDNRTTDIRRRGLDMLANAGELEYDPDGRAIRKAGAIQIGDGDWLDE